MSGTHLDRAQFRDPDGRPTPKQVYALAAVLLRLRGERWPATRFEAARLLHRLWREEGRA